MYLQCSEEKKQVCPNFLQLGWKNIKKTYNINIYDEPGFR